MLSMKKLFISFSIFLFCFSGLRAQEPYLEEVTDSVDIETYTYAEKDGQKLDLDIYLPIPGAMENKPVFLYVHGGGFSAGKRDEPGIVDFCRKVARRGYTAVSISYRLTRKGTDSAFGCDCPSGVKLSTFSEAVEDLQDATFFLVQHYGQFGIDPHCIILAGSSAGAETVLNAAYKPPYCYGLDSGPVAYAGVISMAGAVPDTTVITNETAIPSMFFHGTCDNLVPYGAAPHHYCKEDQSGYLMLYGPEVIAGKLRRLGKPYWLYTICGGDHAVAGMPMTDYFEEIIRFCHDYVLEKKLEQRHTIIPGRHNCDFPDYNYCEQEDKKQPEL